MRVACLALALLLGACGESNKVPDLPAPTSQNTVSEGRVTTVPIANVRVLDGPFFEAQQRNLDYVLAMDVDRLLAPYLHEAGLPTKADNYGNWESTGLNGHIGGHYLSALALATAATGNTEAQQRLQYMLDELQRAQQANGNGYLGGVPGSKELWQQVGAGEIRADLFALNESWVPWYNLHKIFAGLRDAWLYTGSPQARDMLVALSDWALRTLSALDETQFQTMLRAEHGGMNEVLADVYQITGDDRYLTLARRFSHRELLAPLQQGEDRLDGLHANTQIPKVVGFERVAQVSGDASWHTAADYFWHTVVGERSVAIGGNSVREHFHARDDFSSILEHVEGPETCNTYNMLRLTRLLFEDAPAVPYADYYERALYNHILSSQDPDSGGLVYFTPIRPQHYRVYSQVDTSMWCCVGSGIENHFRYGEFIYARDDEGMYVNLFISSRVSIPEKALVLRQDTQFPDQSETRLVIERGNPGKLNIRYPQWVAAGALQVHINGELQSLSAQPGEYFTLQRDWQAGDEVRIALPMQVHSESLPDGSDYYALLYGPIVLSSKVSPLAGESLPFLADDSRMGHIAAGPTCPISSAPMLVSATPEFAAHVRRVDGEALRFRFDGLLEPARFQNLELIPFYRLHHSRYMLYWPYSTPEGLAEKRQAEANADSERERELALTIDSVAPGEQQPEVEHDYAGSGSEAGVNFGRHWRHASDWFGYRLSDPEAEATVLRITYWGADSGRRFRIELQDELLAEVELRGEHGPEFVTVDYPLPENLPRSEDGSLALRFVAGPDSIAGGIYGVRLLRAPQ